MQNDGAGRDNPTLDASGYSYPHADELVGRFPNLEILHLLGQGGMGAVYLARQTKLDRVVALKVLSPRLGNDPSFTERFTREAKTLARLSHPNIVTVFDYGQTENLNYLLMEYVDGINLRDAIQTGKLTPAEALAIVPQICDALQYAHNAGVIHRDIKPENILLDPQGHVKIADFGLAKLLNPNQKDFTLTGTNQVLGTRNYMAPEQIEKPEVVDHRADIYSLGVVFYELLTGELPIGRFSAPSEKIPVNHQLDDIVLRTLEKEPDRRFQQASEIRDAVDSLASPDRIPTPPVDPVGPQASITTLPFSIGELYAGFATAHGIAHLFSDRIELEYEVVDDLVGAVKSSAHQISIPISCLVTVQFAKGILTHRIEFQTDRLGVVQDVPNSKQGRFSLSVKRRDIELAKHFAGQVDRLRREIRPQAMAPGSPVAGFQQQPVPNEYRQPSPPQKSSVAGPVTSLVESRRAVVESLKIPRIGFVIVGVIHLLIATKGFVQASTWRELASLNFEAMPSVEVSLFLPLINMGIFHNLIVYAIGILLLSIASRLRHPRDYKFVFVALILVMMAPIHFAYIVTFFLSIWALVNLNDPRCKEVYRAADNNQFAQDRRNASFFHPLVIGLLVFAGLVAVPAVSYLLFHSNATWSTKTAPVTETEDSGGENSKATLSTKPATVTVTEDSGWDDAVKKVGKPNSEKSNSKTSSPETDDSKSETESDGDEENEPGEPESDESEPDENESESQTNSESD